MAASGTTKNITTAELAVAVGVGGRLTLATVTGAPSTPSAGDVKLFTRTAARSLPAFMGPSGVDSSLQTHLGANRASWYRPVGNATTVETPGIVLTAIGTATAANWASTNLFTNGKRMSHISAGTAGSAGGWRENVLKYSIGSNNWGGFHVMARFGCLTLPAGYRQFVGLYGTAGVIGNVDPSSLFNILGLAKDTADTNLQFIYNDASGTATKIDTGVAMATSDVFDFRMFTPPGGSTIYFALQKVTGGGSWVLADTGGSANVPAASQGLGIQNWCNNGATASAIDPHWFSYYIETDN